MKLLDCTFRDGGYYVNWDFPKEIVNEYLQAMSLAKVDVVELGFRFLKNDEFKGANAYTSDKYLRTLSIPENLMIAVMVNGSDLITNNKFDLKKLELLFPENRKSSPVELVRVACHFQEFIEVLPAIKWLNEQGFKTGINLMQITERNNDEIANISKSANSFPLDVLYFADSLGSMRPKDVANIVNIISQNWQGEIGIHTHDNLGLGLLNTIEALNTNVTWLDSTVTGMGRGPGNTSTETLLLELSNLKNLNINILPLLTLIKRYFKPLKDKHAWGTNSFYYLSGQFGIHPTYVQEMLNDSRYSDEDILSTLLQLKHTGGKNFSKNELRNSRNLFGDKDPKGNWNPANIFKDQEVLLIGTGSSVEKYNNEISEFIKDKSNLIVIAINAQKSIPENLINYRVACHPFRILADLNEYVEFNQTLITPYSLLPEDIKLQLKNKNLLDFGIKIENDNFEIYDNYCVIPSPLVLAYALSIIISSSPKVIYLVGFDGYEAGDSRNNEVENIFKLISQKNFKPNLMSLTPTKYINLKQKSLFGLL
jgi:4-hydroxy 2-oxovalerate aldolase